MENSVRLLCCRRANCENREVQEKRRDPAGKAEHYN